MSSNYEVFEGAKDLKTVRRNEDVEFFQRAKKKLNFELDLDLIAFCTSIGLYRSKLRGVEKKEPYPSLTKLTNILSFERRQLFDLLLLAYVGVEKDRMKEFEAYFYTGFKILEEWFEKNDKNMINSIDRFSSLYDYLSAKN
jgi:hypothetical protein